MAFLTLSGFLAFPIVNLKEFPQELLEATTTFFRSEIELYKKGSFPVFSS